MNDSESGSLLAPNRRATRSQKCTLKKWLPKRSVSNKKRNRKNRPLTLSKYFFPLCRKHITYHQAQFRYDNAKSKDYYDEMQVQQEVQNQMNKNEFAEEDPETRVAYEVGRFTEHTSVGVFGCVCDSNCNTRAFVPENTYVF